MCDIFVHNFPVMFPKRKEDRSNSNSTVFFYHQGGFYHFVLHYRFYTHLTKKIPAKRYRLTGGTCGEFFERLSLKLCHMGGHFSKILAIAVKLNTDIETVLF
ncbi:hypothetical protein SAMN04488577_3237 [Bacillus sp. cl95]|nr:hypothetical protein SAMN02799634_104277 [Bacillus sp. UNCCL13]SFQ88543.1 hypothetical protein SAMN04488577_3237 [Bacillus sp. cl95]